MTCPHFHQMIWPQIGNYSNFVIRLTIGILCGDGLRLHKFAGTNIVLGTHPEHILLAFSQALDKVRGIILDLSHGSPCLTARVSLLKSVRLDRFPSVVLGRIPGETGCLSGNVRHSEVPWHRWFVWKFLKFHQSLSTCNKKKTNSRIHQLQFTSDMAQRFQTEKSTVKSESNVIVNFHKISLHLFVKPYSKIAIKFNPVSVILCKFSTGSKHLAMSATFSNIGSILFCNPLYFI